MSWLKVSGLEQYRSGHSGTDLFFGRQLNAITICFECFDEISADTVKVILQSFGAYQASTTHAIYIDRKRNGIGVEVKRRPHREINLHFAPPVKRKAIVS